MRGFYTKNPKQYHELALVELPEETETYKPVAHTYVVDQLRNYGTAYLGDVVAEGYGLSEDGQQMFGMLRFENQASIDGQESDVTVGIRNSYDKSLALGVVAGLSMIVCDNLVLSGTEKLVRKHTKYVMNDIDGVILSVVKNAYPDAIAATKLLRQWSETELSDDDAYSLIGRILGHKVAYSSHCTGALREWRKPTYSDWGKNNVHALYQAFTHALKKSRAAETSRLYTGLHKFFATEFPAHEVSEPLIIPGRFAGIEMN